MRCSLDRFSRSKSLGSCGEFGDRGGESFRLATGEDDGDDDAAERSESHDRPGPPGLTGDL
ncbi:MAG: hypothetical protein R2705_15300 [Ilumatobacteraceae bacterium]